MCDTIKLSVCLLLLTILASVDVKAEQILWSDTCQQLHPKAYANDHVKLTADPMPVSLEEKNMAMRVELDRSPGLTEAGFNGWFVHGWRLPKIKLDDHCVLKLNYRYDKIENYYPALRIHLIDSDGTRGVWHWNPNGDAQDKLKLAGHWLDVTLPVSTLQIRAQGKNGILDDVVNMKVVYNYRSFRSLGTYTRWFDDVQLIRLDEAIVNEKPGQQQAGHVEVKRINPAFDVLFVPYVPSTNGQLSDMGTFDERSDIPHARYNAWQGPKDMSVRFQAGWNEFGLRLQSYVVDDVSCHDFIDAPDFKDSDNWRLYFDLDRAGIYSGQGFDQNDYILAAIADSPTKQAMVRQVIWGFMPDSQQANSKHIKVNGQVTDLGWDLGLTLENDAFKTFQCKPNTVFSFASSWQDTDDLTRDNELFWPSVRGKVGDNYWRKLDVFGDMVLAGPQGGFTFRIDKRSIARGEPCVLQLAGKSHKDVRQFRLVAQLKNEAGQVVRQWDQRIDFADGVNWLEITLPTEKLVAGEYEIYVSLQAGKLKWSIDDGWPLNINQHDAIKWEHQLTQRVSELEAFLKEGKTQIKQLDAKGYPTQYLLSGVSLVELFMPDFKENLQQKKFVNAQRLSDGMIEAMQQTRRLWKNPEQTLGNWRRITNGMRPGQDPSKHRFEFDQNCFRVDGKPTFFIGFTSDWGWKTPMIGKLGFNAMHTNFPMRFTMKSGPTQTAMDSQIAQSIDDRYEAYQKAGLWAMPASFTAGSPAPDWLLKDQSLSQSNGHFIPYSLESEKMPVVMQNRYKILQTELNKQPLTAGYLLLNEPAYEGRTETFERLFQSWLKERYQSIDKLNDQWQMQYQSFDAIPNDKLTSSVAGRRDWANFNRHHMTEHVRMLHGFKQQYDQLGRPDHVKFTSKALRSPDGWESGCDWEAVSNLTDTVGYDCGGNYDPMMTDFMHSLAPGKALANTEVHVHWSPEYTPWLEQWRLAAHGCDAMVHWQWLRPQRSGQSRGYPLVEPLSLYKTAVATLDQQRLATQLVDLSKQKREVAILYSIDNLTLAGKQMLQSIKQAYEALQYGGALVRFLTFRQLNQGQLNTNNIKLLIVPSILYANDDAINAVQKYARNGGKVLLVGEHFKFDTTGRQQKPADLMATHVDVNSPIWQDDIQRYQLFDSMLAQAGVLRPARVLDEKDQPVYGVEILSDLENKIVFIASVQSNVPVQSLKLTWNGKPAEGINLIDNTSIDGKIQLHLHEAMMIQIK